jgi:hypothetical protein
MVSLGVGSTELDPVGGAVCEAVPTSEGEAVIGSDAEGLLSFVTVGPAVIVGGGVTVRLTVAGADNVGGADADWVWAAETVAVTATDADVERSLVKVGPAVIVGGGVTVRLTVIGADCVMTPDMLRVALTLAEAVESVVLVAAADADSVRACDGVTVFGADSDAVRMRVADAVAGSSCDAVRASVADGVIGSSAEGVRASETDRVTCSVREAVATGVADAVCGADAVSVLASDGVSVISCDAVAASEADAEYRSVDVGVGGT